MYLTKRFHSNTSPMFFLEKRTTKRFRKRSKKDLEKEVKKI
jgi:hypothetical protein